jgi:hypothetical protein
MKANATLDMPAVVTLIAKAIDVSEANARSYYRYIVQNGLADGKVVTKTKEPKAVTKGRDSVNKTIAKQFAKKEAAADKTLAALEELQMIKEKNFQSLREATEKRKQLEKLHAKVREEHEADEAEAAKEDPRDYVPKFLHKELGLL